MKTFLKKACTVLLAGAMLVPSLASGSKVLADENKLPSGTPTAQIGQKIEDYVDQHKKTTASMATAVFDKNGIIYQGNFGYIDKEKKIAVDDDTVFEWGSVTKLTVWVSVMQLWEEGNIDLEEDVRNYLPKGFLKKLNFDQPITMLDLMNHQAGFGENFSDLLSKDNMEETLGKDKYKPVQTFAPKSIASYSNYGTGLAALIVERVSGQSFKDYVHEHIFKPLGMTKTAILPDLSDNSFVFNKHKEVKGYNAQGNKLDYIEFEITLYPVGRATGTLSDFIRFGQAFVKQETGVLFKRPETWTTLLQPTAYYGDTDTPSNSHGFWHLLYENDVYTVGHGGNTTGFSSYLRFDPVSEIGTVVMTNQQDERVYNTEMQELIFDKSRTIPENLKSRIRPGFYVSLRTYSKGPFSISKINSLFSYQTKDSQIFKQAYSVPYHANGMDKISQPYGELYKLSDLEVTKLFSLFGSRDLALVYALLTLLAGLVLTIYRRIKKQEAKLAKSWRVWHTVNAGLIALTGLTTIFFFQAGMLNLIKTLPYYSIALLVLLIGLFLSLIWAFVRRKKFSLTKLQAVRIGLTGLASSAVIINILYWNLYQFWLL